MTLQLDHLAIVVPDLDQAVAVYTALGFTVVPGGRHLTASHNALIGLADGSYLELFAFIEPDADRLWWDRLEQGGGLADYCVAAGGLAETVAALRESGVPMSGAIPMGRVRPDGYALRWACAIPEAGQGVIPFLIEDETPRSERVPQQHTHANGVTGVRRLTIALPDPAAFLPALEAVFGPGAPVERVDLTAHGVRFTVGHTHIDALAPLNSASPLTTWIAQRGPALYSVEFHTQGQRVGALPLAETLNTHLSFVAEA